MSPLINRRRLLLQGLSAAAMTGIVPSAHSQSVFAKPLATNLVTATASRWNGRDCLAVELTDEAQDRARKGGGGNGPSYAIMQRDFTDGVIEIEIGAELTGKGGEDARGFAGLAFHIDEERQLYEAVYLRMTNGRLNDPKPSAPRIDRAIQYVAHPDFHFSVSRAKSPDKYEKGADIAVGRWHRLRLEIQGARARAFVDGVEALTVDDLHYAGRRGGYGLFIDDGSRGFFANLSIRAA